MKINLIFSILYIIIIVTILLSITIFQEECWKYLLLLFPNHHCACEIFLSFYIIIIPTISFIFAIILNKIKKSLIIVPFFMSMIVFSFCIADCIVYDIRHGYSLLSNNAVISCFLTTIPTVIGSLFGVGAGKVISLIYNKFKKLT